ncbi:response regulator [bacterium]|nr:response regulator [bacterium]
MNNKTKAQMSKRVLIVDDEARLRTILERVLNERGYAVKTAVNGNDALRQMPSFNPHLIIADVAMPEMDGFELCRNVRADGRFGSVRFIFLTAKDAREDEIEGLSLGADDYITKPFDVDKLLARVDARLRWLDNVKLGPSSDGSLEGSLAGRNLIDILQILELGQKTGSVSVTSENQEAIILISNGEVVQATCGKKKGKIAVFTALAWPEGRFFFNPFEEVQVEERLKITPLLLEWAKVADEFEKNKPISSGNIVEDFIRYVRERENEGS